MRQSRFLSPVPKIWLMTDQRNDDGLEARIANLPRQSGIIFRHHHLDLQARARRFKAVQQCARQRDLVVILAGPPALARQWGADGVHGRQWKRHRTTGLIHSAPVHDSAEIQQARGNGADLFFVSPVCATRSHPGQKPLSQTQLRRLAAMCHGPVILLGGMDASRFERKWSPGVAGWAAIDAFGATA